MTIVWLLPVALSLAETLRMPLASISKCHLDLRHAARCRRDVGQVKATQRLVIAGAFTLALQARES